MFFLLDLFARLGSLSFMHVLVYGMYVFLTIYALTDLMDRHKWNFIIEIIRIIAAASIFYWQGDWFGHGILPFIVLYHVLSFLASVWVHRRLVQNDALIIFE